MNQIAAVPAPASPSAETPEPTTTPAPAPAPAPAPVSKAPPEKTVEQRLADSLHHIAKRLDGMQTTLTYMAMGPRALVDFVHHDVDVVMHLPDAMTDNIQKHIMEKRAFWEEPLLVKVRSHLAGCRLALDIGANIGNHTLYFALVGGAEQVIAVEPQAHVHKILARNIALNGAPAEAIRAAVGAAPGRARIGLHRHRSFHGTTYRAQENSQDNSQHNGADTASSTAPNTVSTTASTTASTIAPEPGDVALTTVDQIAGTRPVDFIKIDVEGMQMQVLEGATGVLTRDRPKLWVELRRNHNEFEPANTFLESLNLGYRAIPLGGDDILFVPG